MTDKTPSTIALICLLALLLIVELMPLETLIVGVVICTFSLYLLINFRYSWPLLFVEVALLLTSIKMIFNF